jgi:hypothetical protein
MDQVWVCCMPSIHHLPVRVQSRSTMGCKCISKLAQSQTPRVSLDLVEHSLQVRNIMASICKSLILLDHTHQVHCKTYLIATFKSNTKLDRLCPSSLHEHGLAVNFQTCFITASECVSLFTRFSLSIAPPIALNQCLQPVQIYSV